MKVGDKVRSSFRDSNLDIERVISPPRDINGSEHVQCMNLISKRKSMYRTADLKITTTLPVLFITTYGTTWKQNVNLFLTAEGYAYKEVRKNRDIPIVEFWVDSRKINEIKKRYEVGSAS